MNYKYLTFLLCFLVYSSTYASPMAVSNTSGATTQTKINIAAFLEDDCRNERKDFSDSDKVTVKWELQADPNDLHQEVTLITVVKVASFFFYEDADGVFTLWDGQDYDSLEGTKATLTSNTLSDTIISSIVFGDVGLGSLSFEFFAGYKKNNDEVIFNSQPYRIVTSERKLSPITDYWPCTLKQGTININSFLSSDAKQAKRTIFTTGDKVTFTAEIIPDTSEINRTGYVYFIAKNLKDGKTYIYNDAWKIFNLDDFQTTTEVTLSSKTSLELVSQELKGLESEYEFSVAYTTNTDPKLEDLKFSKIYKITVSKGEPTPLVDSIPDEFFLTDQTQADVSTSYNSNTITVSGIDTGVTLPISLTKGEYSVNDAAYTSEEGVVKTGDTVTVKFLSSENEDTITDTVLSIGSISATYSITTNNSPTISSIANKTINQNTATSALAFSVGDNETAANDLELNVFSSNTNLISKTGIVLGGSGSSRTITLTPKNSQTGTATITITTSDGLFSAQASFKLTVKSVNTKPTITGVGDLTIDENTTTSALPVTIGDSQTTAANLVLTASSSNTALIDNSGITLGGSGSSRTATLTPKNNQTGTATITLTVSDGSLSNQTSFLLTVNAANSVPSISAPSDQTIDENTTASALAVTVGDSETPAGSLTLTASSSNTNLIDTADITLGGSGTSRTITLTPKSNQNGAATITLTVNDGSLSTQASFDLTVNPVNTAPTVVAPVDLAIIADTTSSALAITVDDIETAAGSLILTAASDNATLIDITGITLGGSGASRTITLAPKAGQTGTAVITLTIDDGSLTRQATFNLQVDPNGAGDPLCAPEDFGNLPECPLF